MKELQTQEMTEKEIKEGLNLFKKYLLKIAYTHANPLEQNCYISSSDIIGVYFPNTEFIQKNHPHYDIAAISKVNGHLGVVFSLKDADQLSDKVKIYFDPFIFESLESLIYNRYELEIKGKINYRLKRYNEELENLKQVKRVYKKDGGNFANTLQNFQSQTTIYYEYTFMSKTVNNIHIGYNCTLWRTMENREKSETPTLDEVLQLIEQRKAELKIWIKTEEHEIKELHKNFTKFEKIVAQLKDFKESISNWHDFEDVMKYLYL